MKEDDLFQKTLQSLDWPRILEHLASFAGSVPGRERILALTFASEGREVQRRLTETTEVRGLLDDGLPLPLGGIRDIRGLVGQAQKGEILVGRELLDVASTLEAAHQLKRTFALHLARCPVTGSVAATFHDLQGLAALLGRSFDGSGEISAAAYPGLARLRTTILGLHSRIKDKLSSILQSEEYSVLAQDQYVTTRSDRYVVPLKVQARSMDIGIVHDTSGSGQTVYVEPRSVVPMNNELKMAEAEYRREEIRILTELTRQVALEAPRILHNVQVLAELELIYARARLSQVMEGRAPELVKHPHVRLFEARHPVLVLRGVQVVPNDLSIGLEFQALILSGPNTGGKTVALKTLGLACLMVRAGLHIPVGAGSEVGIFSHVLTDIGDQQTVEQDLSTFSGHILGIKRILDHVGEDASSSLVLLDEIAVGTDPVQGAALARSLLEAFVERGAKVVVTTHYAELKSLSVHDRRFANGRVDFDVQALKPTYRLVLGTPGRSYALDIAAILGLRPEVIDRARGYLQTEQRALEDLLGDLEKAQSAVREQRIMAERARSEAESLRRRYEQQIQEIEKEADRLRLKATARFEAEVRAAREEIAKVVTEIQKGSGARLITARTAREKVSEISRKVMAQAPVVTLDPVQAALPVPVERLKIGGRVLVVTLRKEGVIQTLPEVPGGQVEVVVGGMRVKVWPDDLRQPLAPGQPITGRPAQASSTHRAHPSNSGKPERRTEPRISAEPGMEGLDEVLGHAFQTSTNTLDLRGLRVEEALDAVGRFLDRISLQNEPIVFVIHGHGTGAMKAAVRDYLKKSPYVDRFQPGQRGQGGDGATVIALH